MINLLKRRNTGLFWNTIAQTENIRVILEDTVDNRTRIDGITWRWNSFIPFFHRGVINSADALSRAANKPRTRQLWSEAGLRIPQTFYRINDAAEWFEEHEDGILIGRPAYHEKGEEFYILDSQDRLFQYEDNYNYWSVCIPKSRELRVFIAFGRVICVAEKIPREGNIELNWNSINAPFINLGWGGWPIIPIYNAIKATEVLGLDFAAIDLIREINGSKWYLLEANTSPNLESNYRIDCMRKLIRWINSQENLRESTTGLKIIRQPESWKDLIHPCILEN